MKTRLLILMLVASLALSAQTEIRIGNQIWMKENINVGIRIPGSQNQTNNLVVEKWCLDNLESNCDKFGGLYQWDEALQYMESNGTKGICPDGWHVPTYREFEELTENTRNEDYENYLISDYSKNFTIEEEGSHLITTSGYYNSAGRNLKAKGQYWTLGRNVERGRSITGIDSVGFGIVPSGYMYKGASSSIFPYTRYRTCAWYWSSSIVSSKIMKPAYPEVTSSRLAFGVITGNNGFVPAYQIKVGGMSVRCIKD